MDLVLEDGTPVDRFDFITEEGKPLASVVKVSGEDDEPTRYIYEFDVNGGKEIGGDNLTSVAHFSREVAALLVAHQDKVLRVEVGSDIRIYPPHQHIPFVIRPGAEG